MKNNNKYHQINNVTNKEKEESIKKPNNDMLVKNQSQINFSKLQNSDSYLINYYSNNQTSKIAPNHSLGYFSTTSSNTNKNNTNNNTNTNIYMNNNTSSNYVNTEKYTTSNYYSARDIIKKTNANSVNKIVKENKPSNISQVSGKINMLQHSSNINSIQNYLKYLNISQKNKNYNKKNSPVINKNKTHKLSANNINYMHNNTESNIYNNTYNFETQNTFSQKTYSRFRENNNNKINSGINEINGTKIETPEELHFFYVKLLNDGKNINFDKQIKSSVKY